MIRVHGGFANRMYRLDTDQGSFAVKELNLTDRRFAYHAEDVFRFERAAFVAGIPMPEPVAASHDTLVHRWVEGPMPEAPVSPAYGFEIGETLARIHSLNVEWPDELVEEPAAWDWPELAEKAVATGQPWADELAGNVETFLAIAYFVDTCERSGPVVLTHKDIQPWNLLSRDGRPLVVDWELSGLLDLAGELGSTAFNLATGPGSDEVEPRVFRSVVDGYVAGGGVVPPAGPGWFVYAIGGWLGHTRWNILRCLAGVEVNDGPDLALSHEVARTGVRGLPEMYRRLPELEELLLTSDGSTDAGARRFRLGWRRSR
jgi:aminoglycoside phosphotransferase (APT) family kinase protein